MILGGGALTVYGSSRAWGINPSAANGTVIIDNTGGGSGSFSIAVGDYVAYSFDSFATFYGIVSETGESASDPTSGLVQTFTVLDNRVRLAWQMVYGAFNMEDEMSRKRLGRPAPPATPGNGSGSGDTGVDFGGVTVTGVVVGTGDPDDPGNAGEKRRRYWHILPEHQASGIRTWTDEPYTAREILNFAFEGAWGDFGFARNYHSALDNLILTGLDHLGGCKLSSFVAEITEKAGLDLHITGAHTLVWGRKGEGLPPLADPGTTNRTGGEAITTNDTALRVMGERTRVQVMNVELEPDWKEGWGAFIDELAWRREVASTFAGEGGPGGIVADDDSKENQANIAAKALSVTVFEYAKKKNKPELLDYRSFGDTSRARMPAWLYIQEFVYRAYRIPPTRKLYGIPISSLEMAESLLCATDIEGEGDDAKQIYKTGPIEFYPSTQAEVIHKGQPLDLIDSRDIRLFYRNTTGDLRNEWTKALDYQVDTVNMGIRFSKAVFIDGLPSEGKSIYLKLNQGEGGGSDLTELVEDGSDYLDVVVPNPAFEILPAQVKASFCFLLGRFQRDYGVGPRRGGLNVSGLGLHVLDDTTASFASSGVAAFNGDDLQVPSPDGRSFKEILYEDGGKAIEKADKASDSQLRLSALQATGGFRRHGASGTPLTGAVDRITVTVTQDGGLTEDVSYTKARASTVAFAEKTLTRIQRTAELFPGQEQLKQEIRQYRNIAFAERHQRKIAATSTLKKIADVFAKPVGGESPQTSTLYDPTPTAAPTRGGVTGWKAGDIVWKDGKGVPSKTGKAFGGVLVATPVSEGEGESGTQTKGLAVATRGIVPVRVRGAISAGGYVLADKGSHYGAATGDTTIGMLMHGDDVPVPAAVEGEPAEVLVLVSLGGGGGASVTTECPFGEIITWTDGSDSEADTKTGVRGGNLRGGKDPWHLPHYEVDPGVDGEWLLFIRTAVVANVTPAADATLAGLASSSAPEWVKTVYDSSSSTPGEYEAAVIPPIFPTSSPGVGKSIVPLGVLKVAGGVVTLQRAGCGDIILTHCPGTLDHYRGAVSLDSSSP